MRKNTQIMLAAHAYSMIVPLLLIPYIIHQIGLEAYGHFAFAQTLAALYMVLVELGFNWSATRTVARSQSQNQRSKVLSAVFAVQTLTFVALTSLNTLIFTLIVPHFEMADAALVAPFFIAATFFFPLWYFQGTENFRSIALYQFSYRSLQAIVFILILSPQTSTTTLAVITFAASAGITVIIVGWHVRRKTIYLLRPTGACMKIHLRRTAPFISSRLSVLVYTSAVPVLLGFAAGALEVSIFTIANKVRSALQSTIATALKVLFPHMIRLFQTTPDAGREVARKSFVAVGLISVGLAFSTALTARWIVALIGGADAAPAALVLQILMVVVIVTSLSNVLGVQVLLPNGEDRYFNTTLTVSAVTAAVLMYPLLNILGAEGAALLLVTVECLVLLLLAPRAWRYMRLQPHPSEI